MTDPNPRPYRHDPDLEFAQSRWDHTLDDFWGLPRTLDNHAKFQTAESLRNLYITAAEGLANGWALGLPYATLRAFWAPVVPATTHTLDQGIRLDTEQLFTVMDVVITVGDVHNANRLAHMAADIDIDDDSVGMGVGSRTLRALGLLTLDRPDDAHEDIATITELLDSPGASPHLRNRYPNTGRMLAGVATRDDDAWLQAAAEHARLSDAWYGSDAGMRRNCGGLLSYNGAALCRLAHVAGMPLPDHPIFAADLIRNL